jgi:hypothetical protein
MIPKTVNMELLLNIYSTDNTVETKITYNGREIYANNNE